jgi:hypothetical protein
VRLGAGAEVRKRPLCCAFVPTPVLRRPQHHVRRCGIPQLCQLCEAHLSKHKVRLSCWAAAGADQQEQSAPCGGRPWAAGRITRPHLASLWWGWV